MFCNRCGNPLPAASQFCSKCGAAQQASGGAAAAGAPNVLIVKTEKSPALAVLLSFLLPGLGQIYNDEAKKGVWFLIAAVVSSLMIIILIGLLTTPIIWIWSMVDAYQVADRKNRALGLV
jgi:TM2 domain-containing membrane protein YozV